MINNSKSLAKIISFPFDTTMEGKIVDATYIKASDYEKYRAAVCVCPGCGAKMVLAHKPHRLHNYYFRAETKHADENCPYNKSNGSGHGKKEPKDVIIIITKTRFPFEIFFPPKKKSKPKGGGPIYGPGKQDGGNKKGSSDGPNGIKEKEDKNKSLEAWYNIACNAPLSSKINEQIPIGELFIMHRSIEAGTISDYTGLHVFVGRTCNYKWPMNMLQSAGKYNSKNNMIIKCESNNTSYSNDLYVFLDFATYELKHDFWNKMKSYNSINSEKTKREDLRILVVNKFIQMYNEGNTTILYAKIELDNQIEIVKRCDDSE